MLDLAPKVRSPYAPRWNAKPTGNYIKGAGNYIDGAIGYVSPDGPRKVYAFPARIGRMPAMMFAQYDDPTPPSPPPVG